MLPAQHRLRKKQDIQRVYKTGKKQYHSVLRFAFVQQLEVPKGAFSRLAVVVSKQVSPSAVQRNRVKRQIRSLLEGRIKQIKPGYDIVVIAQPKASRVSYQQLGEALDQLFSKNELYSI